MKTIQTIIEEHVGPDAVMRSENSVLCVVNPPHPTLVIKTSMGLFPRGGCYVHVCQTSPSDLFPNTPSEDDTFSPELVFCVTPDLSKAALAAGSKEWRWFPLRFYDDDQGVRQEAAEIVTIIGDDVPIHVLNPALVEELRLFAEMWDGDLARQGYLEAFRRIKAAADRSKGTQA